MYLYDVSANNVLRFLQVKFKSQVAYGSVSTSRSALALISLDELAKHSLIHRFLKGVFKLRPPKAKYNCTWDTALVLTYLAQWYQLSQLSLRQLTFRLVMLLALVSARVQILSFISADNILEIVSGFRIFVPNIIKISFC